MLRSPRFAAAPFIFALLTASCGGGNAASKLARPPELDIKGQAKCGVAKSQSRPLIVEWPSADRGQLEAQAHNHGVVVVHYAGCEMRVLDRCTVPIRYGYTGITRKRDRVTMRDADDLYANVPLGAAKLESKLASSGELDVQMTIVGRWEAERSNVRRDELQGDCGDATHVVSALSVGAFDFFAGADASVGGGAGAMGAGVGAQSSAKREMLNEDGDEKACEHATSDDKKPPEGCGAILRLEVVPLAASGEPAAPRTEPRAAAAPGASVDLTGDWASECENGGTPLRTTLHVKQTGDAFTATFDSRGKFEGTVRGRSVSGTWSNLCGSGQPCSGRFVHRISDDARAMDGSWGFGEDASTFKCHATKL
jgi:hypothetical protein